MLFEVYTSEEDPILTKSKLVSEGYKPTCGIDRYVRRYEYRYFSDFASKFGNKEWKRIDNYNVWTDGRIVIKENRDREAFDREIRGYRLLSEIVPSLVQYQKYPYEDEEEEALDYASREGEFYLAAKYVGSSLAQLYYGLSITEPPYISEEKIPIVIMKQIENIKQVVSKQGLYIDDEHAGNYTLDANGKVWLIDLEHIYEKN